MLRIAARAAVVDDDWQLPELSGAHALWAEEGVAVGDAVHAATMAAQAVERSGDDRHSQKPGHGRHDERHPYRVRDL